MAIYTVKLGASGNNNGDSWNNAYTDLQSALTDASSGDEIWVAAGTYKPGSERTNSFELKDGVTIYGGFAGTEDSLDKRNIENNETILSGSIGDENNIQDNSYTVVKLSSGTATLDGFTIQDGFSNKDAKITDENKDDINNNGGGIHNRGDLTLRNIVVKDNQANADGGGIYNDGTLTIENSVVSNNKTEDDGGGIRNNGTITIIDSTIADNESVGTSQTSGGGGLINTGESAIIINSTFSGNTSKNGGAIRNDTVLNLINSTLSGNIASESGGGLVNTINPIIIGASIFSGADNLSGTAQITITNSTITNNTAQDTSQSASPVGSGIANFAVLNISNSIIAGNANNDDLAHNFTVEGMNTFADPATPFSKTVTGRNTSTGNNIIGNGEGVSGFTDGTNGDQVGTQAQPINPLLNPLDDNGGATQTHTLKEGSPAINAGDNSKIAGDTADLDGDNNTSEDIPFEQRGAGFERIVDSNVDIGAVEFVADTPTNDSETTTGGDDTSGSPILTPLTEGRDRFRGTATDDAVSSGMGNDFLNGEEGNDVLDAGADNDRVYGGIGEDTLKGGTGNDYLNGGTDNDSLEGGEGKDRIYGGDGVDIITGGLGNDYLNGGNGNDSLDGGEGRDRIYGGDGDDTLTGGIGNDFLKGGDGNDTLTGVNADNFVVGELDKIYGGAGNDTFILGNANGAFYADDNNATNGKRDYGFILDFETGDTIQLHGSAEDYILSVSRGSTRIYLNDDGVDGLTRNDELIGVIKGISLQDMSQGFSFVGDVAIA